MDEGGSRIRRRVAVRKRNRPSLESIFAASTAAELQPGDEEEEEKEEMMAGSRRKKTAEVQPVENNDSDEDMFGDSDSFADNSFLPQVDDLERCMQLPEHRKRALDLASEQLCSESNEHNKLNITTIDSVTELKMDEHTKNHSRHEDVCIEPEPDILYDIPSSQVLYFENLQNSSNDLGDQSTKERDWNASSHQTMNEELPQNSVEQHQQIDDSSSKVRTSSEENKRKSLKEHLKNAMTGNAKAQTPIFSKTKQLKETLLSEEINIAKKTMESSSDDLGPFYSLPSKVRDLYVQFKGIEKLYGNAFC